MKKNPVQVIFLSLFLSIIFFAFAVKICEFPITEITSDPSHDLSSFSNSCWLVVLTMTTVGYGDFFPVTMFGRIVMTICCLWGITVVSLVVVTVQNVMNLSGFEGAALLVMQRLSRRQAIKNHAAFILTLLAKFGKHKRKFGVGNPVYRDNLFKHANILKKEQNNHRALDRQNFGEDLANQFQVIYDENRKFKINQEKSALALYLTAQQKGILPEVYNLILKVLNPEQRKILEGGNPSRVSKEEEKERRSSITFRSRQSQGNSFMRRPMSFAVDERDSDGLERRLPNLKRLRIKHRSVKLPQLTRFDVSSKSSQKERAKRERLTEKPEKTLGMIYAERERKENILNDPVMSSNNSLSENSRSRTKSNPGKPWLKKPSVNSKLLKANSAEGLAWPEKADGSVLIDRDFKEDSVVQNSMASGEEDRFKRNGNKEKLEAKKRRKRAEEQKKYSIVVVNREATKMESQALLKKEQKETKKWVIRSESNEDYSMKSIFDGSGSEEVSSENKDRDTEAKEFDEDDPFRTKEPKSPKTDHQGLQMLQAVFNQEKSVDQSYDEMQFEYFLEEEKEHLSSPQRSPKKENKRKKSKENGEKQKKTKENLERAAPDQKKERSTRVKEHPKEENKGNHEERNSDGGYHSSPSESSLDEIDEKRTPESFDFKSKKQIPNGIEIVEEVEEEHYLISSSDDFNNEESRPNRSSSNEIINETSGRFIGTQRKTKKAASGTGLFVESYKQTIQLRSDKTYKTEPPISYQAHPHIGSNEEDQGSESKREKEDDPAGDHEEREKEKEEMTQWMELEDEKGKGKERDENSDGNFGRIMLNEGEEKEREASSREKDMFTTEEKPKEELQRDSMVQRPDPKLNSNEEELSDFHFVKSPSFSEEKEQEMMDFLNQETPQFHRSSHEPFENHETLGNNLNGVFPRIQTSNEDLLSPDASRHNK